MDQTENKENMEAMEEEQIVVITDDEGNVIIARIEFDENGEEVYLVPTDEEIDEVKAAYEKLMEDWDEE